MSSMSSHQKYIISISFLAFAAFLVLLAFFHSIRPLTPSIGTEQIGIENYTGEKDVLVTPGESGSVPKVLSTDPVLGSPDANVMITVFSDFQCPYCAETHVLLRELYQKYPKDVRIVWKDFPLPSHLFAKTAAFAGRCAAHEGVFWEFVDDVFLKLAVADPLQVGQMLDAVVTSGESLGIPSDRFRTCIESQQYADEVGSNITQGLASDIDGVPYLFVNDLPISGQPTKEGLEAMVQAELQK